MQAAAFQNKRPGHDGGAHDPHYENITLAFRNRDQSKPSQAAASKQATAQHNPSPDTAQHKPSPDTVQHKPSPDTAQVPSWLHRAIIILYILLALIFLSCIILSALVLVKNSEMSRELLGLKGELSNVSSIVQSCQNQQLAQWLAMQKNIQETTKEITVVRNKVQSGEDKLKTLSADISHIKKTLESLEKKTQTPPTRK